MNSVNRLFVWRHHRITCVTYIANWHSPAFCQLAFSGYPDWGFSV